MSRASRSQTRPLRLSQGSMRTRSFVHPCGQRMVQTTWVTVSFRRPHLKIAFVSWNQEFDLVCDRYEAGVVAPRHRQGPKQWRNYNHDSATSSSKAVQRAVLRGFRSRPGSYARPSVHLKKVSLFVCPLIVCSECLLHRRHSRNFGYRNVPPGFITGHSHFWIGFN